MNIITMKYNHNVLQNLVHRESNVPNNDVAKDYVLLAFVVIEK